MLQVHDVGRGGDPERAGTALPEDGRRGRNAAPADIMNLQHTDPGLAARWRRCMREAFERCLAAGFRVQGFHLHRDGGGAFYLLARE